MLTRDETAQPARASDQLWHSRLRRYTVWRGRQLLLVVMILAAGLLVVACGVEIRRATCLIGLPDVGDPFDVVAFCALQVPEDQDAFVLFRQAAAKCRPMPELPMAFRRAGTAVNWLETDPKLRAWAEANREALIPFQQGAERADGTGALLFDADRRNLWELKLDWLVWLALLDAARLEGQGDMAAAWGRYRAILLMKAHIMRRGTVFDRYIVNQYTRWLNAANRHLDCRPEDPSRLDPPSAHRHGRL